MNNSSYRLLLNILLAVVNTIKKRTSLIMLFSSPDPGYRRRDPHAKLKEKIRSYPIMVFSPQRPKKTGPYLLPHKTGNYVRLGAGGLARVCACVCMCEREREGGGKEGGKGNDARAKTTNNSDMPPTWARGLKRLATK